MSIDHQQAKAGYLDAIAKTLEETLPTIYGEDMGFALLIFRFGGPGRGDYVSNANREDMVLALREAADRLEAGQDIPRTIGRA